jgi:MtN3 and saliva related transmembrane protein
MRGTGTAANKTILMTAQIIGFGASTVLLATLIHQVWKQWSSGRSEGVSPWLFVGQAVANLGMLTYSIMLGDTVFIVTNSATLATSCLGFAVQMRHAARASASAALADSAVSWCPPVR